MRNSHEENIRIDESRLPLFVATFLGSATNEEFAEYLRRLSANLARRQPTAIVVDSRKAVSVTAAQRKQQAEWIDANRDDLRRYVVGTAFVIESALMRGALTAIFWMTSYETPYVVVPTFEAGETWALEQLRKSSAL